MKILAIIVFTFISNIFAYLTEQVSNFVPQQDKSLTKKPRAQTPSVDKINDIDINMRDIIIAIDTRQITENKGSNENKKQTKRNKRRGRRNNRSNKNKQYHNDYNEYNEDDYYNEDDSIVNQYNLDNTYY